MRRGKIGRKSENKGKNRVTLGRKRVIVGLSMARKVIGDGEKEY